ncbi:hypothetical protein CYMTET_31837 [Cymbomonas tetramitiformis]|uniref:BTB domain-containing protein n=1 Tax=Cymbomonas tetramitiformis TaxID=36881 RepID=A0AAE0FG32_9CHLO|nr:hypothetical protein CYMTET_31837 [Cymbomonas tetramitiformis]|eukprot:gene29953-37389_t
MSRAHEKESHKGERTSAPHTGNFTLKPPVKDETDALSDVRVRFAGTARKAAVEFDCHRFVLAQGCAYFRELFRTFPDERVLTLYEVQAEEFEVLLGVLYGQKSLLVCAERVSVTTESFLTCMRMADYVKCEPLISALLDKIDVLISREVTRFFEHRHCYVEEMYALCRDHRVCLTDSTGLRPPQNALLYRMVEHLRECYTTMFDPEKYGVYTYNSEAPKRAWFGEMEAGAMNVSLRRVLSSRFVQFDDLVRIEDPPWMKIFAALIWCDDESKLKETERYISQLPPWDETVDSLNQPRSASLAPKNTLECLNWHMHNNAWMFSEDAALCRLVDVRFIFQKWHTPLVHVSVRIVPKYHGCLHPIWATAEGAECFGRLLIDAHMSIVRREIEARSRRGTRALNV